MVNEWIDGTCKWMDKRINGQIGRQKKDKQIDSLTEWTDGQTASKFYKSNLSTKLKVGHRYGNLSTSDNQDNKDEVEKTK